MESALPLLIILPASEPMTIPGFEGAGPTYCAISIFFLLRTSLNGLLRNFSLKQLFDTAHLDTP